MLVGEHDLKTDPDCVLDRPTECAEKVQKVRNYKIFYYSLLTHQATAKKLVIVFTQGMRPSVTKKNKCATTDEICEDKTVAWVILKSLDLDFLFKINRHTFRFPLKRS